MPDELVSKETTRPRETHFIKFTPEYINSKTLSDFFGNLDNVKKIMPGKDRKRAWNDLKNRMANGKLTDREEKFLDMGLNLFNPLVKYLKVDTSGDKSRELWGAVQNVYNSLPKDTRALMNIGELLYAYYIVNYVRTGKVDQSTNSPEKLAALTIAAMRNQAIMHRDSVYQTKTPGEESDEEGSGLRGDDKTYTHYNYSPAEKGNIRNITNEGKKKIVITEGQFNKIVESIIN